MSILCVLSKVLERAVHSQLCEYLEKRGLIFDHQSGFRGGYSTDSCLVGLSDYVAESVILVVYRILNSKAPFVQRSNDTESVLYIQTRQTLS